MASVQQFYLDEFQRLYQSLPGQQLPWMRALRSQAAKHFEHIGFPAKNNESWKYTRLNEFLQHTFSVNPSKLVPSVEALQPFVIEQLDCYQLVFINGCLQQAVDKKLCPRGVKIVSLAEQMADDQNAELEAIFNAAEVKCQHGFWALNTALLQDGAFIKIDDNTHLDKPIHCIYVNIAEEPSAHASYLRNIIRMGKNARCTLIESHIGLAHAQYFTNTISDIFLDHSAHLEHYKLQHDSLQAYHFGHTHVHQCESSHYFGYSLAMGGKLVRSDTDVNNQGEYAHSALKGLFIAKGSQHIDHHTRIEHNQSQGISQELYKGILDESATGVFNGTIYVHPDAQKIKSAQQSKNLLLSSSAHINTKPELEIYADDVQCSHGATVGELDDNMLFYLQSRGLDQQAARDILTYAFAKDVINLVELDPLKQHISDKVLQHLPGGYRLEGSGL